MRFLSYRYNFIFQKLAFFKYKITRSDDGVISKWRMSHIISIVLDTFCRCKSLALHLQNTRSDDRVNSVLEFLIHFYIINLGVKAIKYLKWWCGKLFSVVLDTFCNSKSWALLLQNTRSDGRVKIEFNRFYSSRYNFIFQKIAFLKYKITRSDGGGIITSTVLDTILYFKN